MSIKRYKPTSAGRRSMSVPGFEEVTKTTPEKALLEPLKKSGGRNNHGHMTIRHRGGGHKRMYRVIDFKRNKYGVPANVAAIEYDPNRNARIALLHYLDGEKTYILAPDGLTVGMTVVASRNADIKVGNSLTLKYIPPGTTIHNVELKKGKGGQLVRSAGSAARCRCCCARRWSRRWSPPATVRRPPAGSRRWR